MMTASPTRRLAATVPCVAPRRNPVFTQNNHVVQGRGRACGAFLEGCLAGDKGGRAVSSWGGGLEAHPGETKDAPEPTCEPEKDLTPVF